MMLLVSKQVVGVVSVADRENLAHGEKNNTVRTFWMSSRRRAGEQEVGAGPGLGLQKGRKVPRGAVHWILNLR